MKALANNDIIDVLNDNGITSDIICHAMLMEMDLPKLIKDKIINKYSDKTKEEVSKNLLGIYGNYAASVYFKSLYNNVENEVSIYDNEGNEITKADISFIDKNGNKNYVEVKAASQILFDGKNYIDDEEYDYNSKEKKLNIIKYKNIGKKLINQVTKLLSTGKKVSVVIFSGCVMDNEIKRKLSEMNVDVITLATNIFSLEEEINKIVESVHKISSNKNKYKKKN